MRPEQQKRTV